MENKSCFDKERLEILKKIRELEFACVDLNLYLDNHPTSQQAVASYNMFTQDLNQLKKIYEAKYGPLSNFGCAPSPCPWTWVDEPWPWEIGE